MLDSRSSQKININREELPFICTHSLKLVLAREVSSGAPRRRKQFLSIFYTTLVEFYTEEVLEGFLPSDFPKENLCVLVHAVLSVIF